MARLRLIDGLEDVAVTTNGYLLPEMARELAAGGAPRVTVSLDSTKPEKFARITRTPRSYEKVMAGIDAALEASLRPVKVNIVLVRGFNDDEIVEFARLARRRDIVVRFIEFMPLDADHAWKRELVVTAKEIVDAIQPVFPLAEIPRHSPSETALRYRFADGQGEIGIIAPVSIPFCGQCSRIRVTADGKLRTCLFSLKEHDVRHLVRNGSTDHDIARFMEKVVHQKEPSHRINEADFVQPSRTMVYIGG
jgi:cyclic pyranopterin phosphate synthase